MATETLTSAALVTQLVLLMIVYFGLHILRSGEQKLTIYARPPRPATQRYPIWFAGFALITLGCLIFSHDILTAARPVFGNIDIPSLGRRAAFLVMFPLDLVGAAILIRFTGGSKNSPFSAVLFVLPSLAIFLREPPSHFLSYAISAGLAFIIVQGQKYWNIIEENPYQRRTFAVVTLGCLALSTIVGYATRPF